MRLTHKQALGILGISFSDVSEITDVEMMKLINQALESLGDIINGKNEWDGSLSASAEFNEADLGDEMNAAINAIIGLGLTIEVCGTWIWVSGDTRPHKEILKESGYKWAPVKKLWHWRPADAKSFSRGKYTMDEIRASHGSLEC
jgi:hypothetical protein